MPSTKDNEKFRDSLFIGKSLLDDALDWIRENMQPDEVFGDNELSEWAEENGFVKGGL